MSVAPSLLSEYLAGATFKQLSIRHGILARTIYDWVVLDAKGTDIATISRQAREAARQDIVKRIASAASEILWLRPGAIWISSRKPELVYARQAVFLVAMEQGLGASTVGRTFNLDHTTIIHGQRRAVRREAADPDYAEALGKIRAAATEARAA